MSEVFSDTMRKMILEDADDMRKTLFDGIVDIKARNIKFDARCAELEAGLATLAEPMAKLDAPAPRPRPATRPVAKEADHSNVVALKPEKPERRWNALLGRWTS